MSIRITGNPSYSDTGIGVDPAGGDATVMGWGILTAGDFGNGPRLCSRWGGSNDRYLLQVSTTGFPLFAISGSDLAGQSVTALTKLKVQTWYHLAATYIRSTSLIIYINGIQDNILTAAVKVNLNPNTPMSTLRFGLDSAGGVGQWEGQLAECATWNRALSAAEILSIATNAASPLSVATPTGYWPLCGYDRLEPDKSGGGNFGTPSGTVAFNADHPRANVCEPIGPPAPPISGRGATW